MNTLGANVGKAAVILALVVSVSATGHAFGGYWGGGKPMAPPREAVDACADLSEGDTVQFTTPCGDTVSGICRDLRGGLIAVPETGYNCRHWRTGFGNRFAQMVRNLNLTETQQKQIRAILESEREKTLPFRQQLLETRKKIREAAEAEPFDESAVRAIAESRSEIRVELDVSRARARSRIHALLTPEQRELAGKFGQWEQKRHRHRRWR